MPGDLEMKLNVAQSDRKALRSLDKSRVIQLISTGMWILGG